MQSDRRAILHLVALGRIAPAEAERLLIAWNEGREFLWILAACLLFAGISQLHPGQFLPALTHLAHAVLPGSWTARQRALATVTCLFGEIL